MAERVIEGDFDLETPGVSVEELLLVGVLSGVDVPVIDLVIGSTCPPSPEVAEGETDAESVPEIVTGAEGDRVLETDRVTEGDPDKVREAEGEVVGVSVCDCDLVVVCDGEGETLEEGMGGGVLEEEREGEVEGDWDGAFEREGEAVVDGVDVFEDEGG